MLLLKSQRNKIMLTLNFTQRNTRDEKSGLLKAVLYGHTKKSEAIFVDFLEFEKFYHKVGQSTVFNLKSSEHNFQAMVQDVAYDPVKNILTHADFYILEKGAKVDTKIPFKFVGFSEAVKSLGAILVKVKHELHIEAAADNIPHEIEVDLSMLTDLDSVIHIKDIKLPNGVSLYRTHEEEVIASVSMPKEEDLSLPVADVDLSNIKVEEKGKKEEVATAENV